MMIRPAAALLAILLLSQSVHAQTTLPAGMRNLGPQITSTLVQGATFASDKLGKEVVCTVMRGTPGKLLVLDAESGNLLQRIALTEAHGAWNACTASDGSVYVATDPAGHVYRYISGEARAEDLGPALDSWAWDVVAGRDGEVFIATYPGAKIVRYKPGEGYSDVSRGPLVDGEQYARSLTYHRETDTIYAGIGAHAHVVKLNPRTGEKVDITPAEIKGRDFAYTVDALGRWLLIHPTPGMTKYVYDIATMTLVATWPETSPVHSSTISSSGKLLFTSAAGELKLWDGEAPGEPAKTVAKTGAINAYMWAADADKDSRLRFFGSRGRIGTLETGNGNVELLATINATLPPEATMLQSAVLGPDGRIWTGGYLSGGAAAYDPATGQSVQFGGIAQPENITVLGDSLYFGLYPRAVLKAFDTTKPWAKDNPHVYAELEKLGQSRPVAMLGVPELNAVFTGTVAEYGHLDGLFARFDVGSQTLTTHRNFVANQSIISLVYHDGLIVGGTSIHGGLGQEPLEKEGKLFVYDPAKDSKVCEIVPAPGRPLVGNLFIGPDKKVWGFAGGDLFVFDTREQRIVRRQTVFTDSAHGENWRGATVAFTRAGRMFVADRGKLYEMNPETWEVKVLREGLVHHVVADRDGRIYFIDNKSELWQYTP